MIFDVAVTITPMATGVPLNQRNFSWDRILQIMQAFNVVTCIGPWFAASFVLYLKLDPFSYTFPKLLTQNRMLSRIAPLSIIYFVEQAFRMLSLYILFGEGCRYFSLFFTLFLYINELTLKLSTLLNSLVLRTRNAGNADAFNKWYTSYTLAANCFRKCINDLTCILMGTGFVVFVVSNWAAIKLRSVLPFYVYWIAPLLSAVCTFFVYQLLTMVLETFRRNTKGIETMKITVAYNLTKTIPVKKAKALKKELRVLKPFYFSCEGFYSLVKGSELEYFFNVFLRTTDALLVQS